MPLLSYYYPTIIKLSTNDYALVILLLSDYHQIFIPLFSHFTTILITLNYHFCPLNPPNFQTNLCRGAGWQPSWLLQYNLDTALSETISWVPQLQLHRMSWDDECVYNTCQSMMSLSQEHAESCYLPSLSIIFLYFSTDSQKDRGSHFIYQRMDSRMREMPDGNPWAEKLGREAMDRIIRRNSPPKRWVDIKGWVELYYLIYIYILYDWEWV